MALKIHVNLFEQETTKWTATTILSPLDTDPLIVYGLIHKSKSTMQLATPTLPFEPRVQKYLFFLFCFLFGGEHASAFNPRLTDARG